MHHYQHTHILIDNLLYWASTQLKGWQLHPQDLELPEIIEEVLELIASNAVRKNITVSKQIPELLSAHTDPNMLKLVLRNILANAIKFTPEGGSIHIAGTSSDSLVHLSVSDTGVGMPPEKLEQFRQGLPLPSMPGTRQETGTGLGILVSRQFLEKQGGSLEIESKPGSGTTVHIKLLEKPAA